ncbi:type VII secretion protein EccB [Bifidobacterium castoris]|uniref:Type VII secretion protein EccB n=1 Tax=Bifidobacterium castoris TaxID=2306972 RepID=A0A430F614_9BIFI|nr:type VII secretion protein EccB [Bifidobacterium castoris]RSX47177.1 type VII secretion protein EccB [Bifidobacterium castoris]
MASKKDLSEAQSYSRRRLVTAFTSGIPDGRELAPKKNQIPVIVGIGLTVIAIIIGIFYGYMKPSLPSNWENNKLIVTKSSAARYVSVKGRLHPVINATSARLMIPSSDFEVITVDDDQLSGIPIDSTLGILGAPDSLPASHDLVTGTMTSCAQINGVNNILTSEQLPKTASDTAIVAHVDGEDYLITDSKRYHLPKDAELRDGFLRALGVPQTARISAPIQWLNLFTEASAFEPLTMSYDHLPANLPDGVKPGTIVTQQSDNTQTKYVVTSEGTISQLDDFAFNLYSVGKTDLQTIPTSLGTTAFQGLRNAEASPLPDDWPKHKLTAVNENQQMCAALPLNTTDEHQHAQFVTMAPDASPSGTSTDAQPASTFSARTRFQGGSGALVRTSIGDSDYGTMFAIDSTGTAYPLPSADEELLNRLGYSSSDVRNIPRAWIDVFPTGVALTMQAAGSPPERNGTAAATSLDDTEGESSQSNTATSSADDNAAANAQCRAGIKNYVTEQPWTNELYEYSTVHQYATGKGVTVAVIDSGVNTANPHFQDAIVDGTSYLKNDMANGAEDVYGHGTVVAGIIAARKIDGSTVQGLAPDAKIMPIRVFDSIKEEQGRTTGGPRLETIAEAVHLAVDREADIINISMSDSRDVPAMREAVDYAESHGALIVASAGNRQTTSDTTGGLRYPAAYPEVLGVSAVNTNLQVTDDSLHGAQVDVAAPGMNIASTIPDGVDCVFAQDAPASSYATAFVSAQAALIAEAHPDETPAQWRQRIRTTANRPHPDQRDDMEGWGVVDPISSISVQLSDNLRGPNAQGQAPNQPMALAQSDEAITLTAVEDPDKQAKTIVGVSAIGTLVMAAVSGFIVLGRRDAVS